MTPVKSELLKQLSETFGFSEFRRGQAEIIQAVLAGRSALAVFPTGSGKSLCYQLPALMLEGVTLVVSPLIALMKDQVDALKLRGVNAARLDSSLTAEETRQVYRAVRSGELQLLYVAPERLSNERFFAAVHGARIAMLVVDEAHCISEWGHNFRPEYLKLGKAVDALKAERVLALTATATPAVVEDIRRAFDIAEEDYVNTGFHRPNLHLSFSPTASGERRDVLVSRLRSSAVGPTIVYVTLQKTAESVADALAGEGFPAKAYHAGMKSEQREAIQNWFMSTDEGIVVATIAFGMGIDKANIRRVYHYDLPKTLENYSQEIGRAGRDGAASHCEVLGNHEELVVLENFIYGDTPDPEAVDALVRFILQSEENFDLSVYHLAQETNIRPLVLNTLLTYLELDGVLAFTATFYSEYKFKYLRPRSEILEAFTGEPREFLGNLLNYATDKKTWSYLNLDAAATALKSERARVVKAITYLEERGKLEVAVTGFRQGMRLLQRPDAGELSRSLMERLQRNEASNLQRTQQVIELMNNPGCKTRFLLSYFGEALSEDCGHCCYCESGHVGALRSEPRRLSAAESAVVADYRAGHPHVAPRAAARMLCGIATPQTSRQRGGKSTAFGALEAAPFGLVLSALVSG